MPPDAFARHCGRRLPVDDGQVITPLCSVQAYLERQSGARVLPIATEPARAYRTASGVQLVDAAPADAVFVAHPARADFDELEAPHAPSSRRAPPPAATSRPTRVRTGRC